MFHLLSNGISLFRSVHCAAAGLAGEHCADALIASARFQQWFAGEAAFLAQGDSGKECVVCVVHGCEAPGDAAFP